LKILTCASYYYYGDSRGIEPQFYYLCRVPETMGHVVDVFDYWTAFKISPEHMRRQFLALVRGGGYDAVFIATHRDEFDRETLAEAARFCPVIGWNSDDEDRWETYSRAQCAWYTFMVTNSPIVYEANRNAFPNLLHAQWASTGFWDGRDVAKDIDISFVGMIYGTRAEQVRELSRTAGLVAYGKGVPPRVPAGTGALAPLKRRVAQTLVDFVFRKFPALPQDGTLNFDQVNALWNRSRVSFTPLESNRGKTMQIKSRVFDMGLSGTLMIAPKGAGIEQYYEPGKEFVEFDDIADFAGKAKYYCAHETERRRIADGYARRTEAEHLWRHRIAAVLRGAGL
jgi:hypothetical protein